jgi:hypothetical protein
MRSQRRRRRDNARALRLADQRSQARIASWSIVSTSARLARHLERFGELASRLCLSAVSKQRLIPLMITTCGADRGSAALKYP